MPQQRRERRARPPRDTQVDGVEHRSNDLEPAFDVSADQQLLRGEALKLHLSRRMRVGCRVEIGAGSIHRTARIGQGGR